MARLDRSKSASEQAFVFQLGEHAVFFDSAPMQDSTERFNIARVKLPPKKVTRKIGMNRVEQTLL